MRKTKIFSAIALLMALVLIGAMCSSTKSFYKKACKISLPFQEKLEDFYGYGESDFGYYDDIDECIEESIEAEEEMYENCMDIEDDDEEECNEMVEEWREFIAEILTIEGCEDFYGQQCEYYEKGSNDYDDCMDEIEELCEDLPKKF